MSLSERTAVVIGGGSGIGEACALALAAEGCRVAIGGRDASKLQTVAGKAEAGQTILTHTIDVGDRASVDAFFAWAHGELGHVDYMINSAGINIPNRAMDAMGPDDWDRVLRINATGAYDCMRAVLPKMREHGGGVIVNISSVSGMRAGLLGGVAYNASKFAMAGLGKTLANEEMNNNIRITTVYPGEVETPILDQRPVPVTAEHRARILQPEDVSDAVMMVIKLPPRAHIPELVIKPTTAELT